MVLKVTIKGGTFVYAQRSPLTNPTREEAAIPITIAEIGSIPILRERDIMATHNPKFAATDKSMPAVNMTRVWPMAIIPRIDALKKIELRLLGLMNIPFVRIVAITTSMSNVTK